MRDHAWIPERGDVVRMSFDPQAGHEQRGWRPAIVVSPGAYNAGSRRRQRETGGGACWPPDPAAGPVQVEARWAKRREQRPAAVRYGDRMTPMDMDQTTICWRCAFTGS